MLQIYIHFIWTVSTSWVMPVIGCKENKDDDDDDDVSYFSTTMNFEKNRGYFCYLLRLISVSCMHLLIFNSKTNSNGT